MATFKVESGMQLLARHNKKPNIENYYSLLFQSGLKYGEIVELYSDEDNLLLFNYDLICEALLPTCFGGTEIGVLFLNCNVNFNYDSFVACIQHKLEMYRKTYNPSCILNNDVILEKALSNLSILEIFDATQLYTTIFNLENLLFEYSNIGIIFFDTITSFYWSEQGYKITKMDVYIKNLLNIIQNVTKEHKITIFYTRPEYFSSVKNTIENLESCSEAQQSERHNYRIQMLKNKDGTYDVNIKTFNKVTKKKFYILGKVIKWI